MTWNREHPAFRNLHINKAGGGFTSSSTIATSSMMCVSERRLSEETLLYRLKESLWVFWACFFLFAKDLQVFRRQTVRYKCKHLSDACCSCINLTMPRIHARTPLMWSALSRKNIALGARYTCICDAPDRTGFRVYFRRNTAFFGGGLRGGEVTCYAMQDLGRDDDSQLIVASYTFRIENWMSPVATRSDLVGHTS